NFRGQQVVFPNKLYSSAYTAQKIREEFNGKNVKELALKYGFTEIWVRTLLKTGNERI
ncbi:Mor transcription activator family protein, partial [Enterocloster clostridioformis]